MNNHPVKTFFKKITFILSVLMVLGIVTQYFFEKYILFGSESSYQGKMQRLINENHPREIAIIGSSIANNSYFPDSISPDCFNYGMNGTEGDVHLILLEKELQKKKTTPIIINLTYSGLHKGIGDVNIWIPFVGDRAVKQLLKENNVFQYRYEIPILRYYGAWFHYIKDILKQDKGYNTTIKGASMIRFDMDKAAFQRQIEVVHEKPAKFHNDSLILHRINMLLIQYPQRMCIFAVAPVHSAVYDKFENVEGQRAFFAHIDSFPNAKVLDFSHTYFPDSLFHDLWHLKMEGAKIFTARLRDSISVSSYR